MKKKYLKFLFLPFALLFIENCSTVPKIKKIETSMFELNSKNTLKQDSVFVNIIKPYKAKMEKIMNEVLIISDQELSKGLPESALGNFVSDVILKKTNDKYNPSDKAFVNICLLNNGGLRSELPKGEITRGNAFELMPFENEIIIVTINGEKAKQLFEYIVEYNGAPFSGATIKAKGKTIIELKINGQLFDINKTYKVTTSDYLAAGGDKYNFFKDPIKTEKLNYKLRDAIIDYMVEENKKGNTLKFSTDGRIKYE
jgi:2',3'-cyclic-nucleotide 2'-phosphodiesterase (5'-nucleotidase family)